MSNKITGDDPVAPTVFRQTGENEFRIATPRDLSDTHNQHFLISMPGINLRTYLAGQAMMGLCANSIPGKHHLPEEVAREAVAKADALIVELNKSKYDNKK